jgi:predicted nicotinamide N-methyase
MASVEPSEGRVQAIAAALRADWQRMNGTEPPVDLPVWDAYARAAIAADDAYLAEHPDEAPWLARIEFGTGVYRVVKP